MRLAVTGALGRVGSYVSRDLAARGHDVVRIDLATEALKGSQANDRLGVDLTEYQQTLNALRGCEAVVHLAAINATIVAPEWRVHNVNVTASFNVLFAAAALGIPRVVQASSVNALGLSWSRKPHFDYFPLDMSHTSYNEDGYSLSKLIQEQQADSITRRHAFLSVISLRLHAVLRDASRAKSYIEGIGEHWAVNGLWGYCTYRSVADVFALALTAPIVGHEVLWVTEAVTFSDRSSFELAKEFYPGVALRRPLVGRETFFDIRRTCELLSWTPQDKAD
jgi:nucleoside-diphosphate-sugar epimerase